MKCHHDAAPLSSRFTKAWSPTQTVLRSKRDVLRLQDGSGADAGVCEAMCLFLVERGASAGATSDSELEESLSLSLSVLEESQPEPPPEPDNVNCNVQGTGRLLKHTCNPPEKRKKTYYLCTMHRYVQYNHHYTDMTYLNTVLCLFTV